VDLPSNIPRTLAEVSSVEPLYLYILKV